MQNNVPIPVYPEYVPPGWHLLMATMCDLPAATTTELAATVGVSSNTVRTWRKKPEFQRFQAWYIHTFYAQQALPSQLQGGMRERRQFKEELSDFAIDMFDRLQDIVENTTDEKLLTQIAHDALDRAGYVATRKVETRAQVMMLTPELLDMLNKRAQEAGEQPILVGGIISGAENGALDPPRPGSPDASVDVHVEGPFGPKG
jgi:transposase-like protein